jgi:hypothetical protein
MSLPHGGITGNTLIEGFKFNIYCVSGDILYYYNSFQNTIDAFNLNTRTKRAIPGNYTIDGLAADNEYLYFINLDDGGKPYRVKLTGEDKLKLSDDYSKFLKLHSGYIFYLNCSDAFSLYKVTADGKNRTKVNYYEISDNVRRLIKYYANADKSELWIASSYEYVWLMSKLYYKGYHYYTDRNSNFCLFRRKNDLTEIKKLTDTPVSSFDIYNDKIYYSKGIISQTLNLSLETVSEASPVQGFFCMSLQGMDIQQVSNETAYYMKVTDKKLFYKSQELGTKGLRYLELENGLVASKVITTDSKIYRFEFKDNCLFYTSGASYYATKLLRFDVATNKQMVLYESEKSISLDFYIFEDKIYAGDYTKGESNNIERYYFRMDTDGTNIESITQNEYMTNNPVFRPYYNK